MESQYLAAPPPSASAPPPQQFAPKLNLTHEILVDCADEDSSQEPDWARTIIIASAIVLVIIILYVFVSNRNIARRLNKSDWMVYYRQHCSYSDKQRDAIGRGFKNYVVCNLAREQVGGEYTGRSPLACDSAFIKGYPFWYNTKTREVRTGYQDRPALKNMVRSN